MSTESSQPQAQRPPPPPLSDAPPPSDARTFAERLRTAGAMKELTEALLEVLLDHLPANDDPQARRLDLLALYYAGGDDPRIAERRAADDRWLLHRADDSSTAHDIVRRLAALAPELGAVSLERIGSDDGPLVVRAGEHLSAVTDLEDDGEDAEHVSAEPSAPETISVRGLVKALNVLLARHQVRERWVALASDGRREAFLAVGLAEAMLLCRAGDLEHASPEAVMEFAAW